MDDLDKLYSAVSAQFDIGDIDTFKSKMKTPEERRSFFDSVSSAGFDLGDYDQYESRLGKQTEVSGQGSLNTSGMSEEPTQDLGLQTGLQEEQSGGLSSQSSDQTFDAGLIAEGGRYDSVTDTVHADLPNVNVTGNSTADKGFMSDLYNSLLSGSSNLGASFAAIPEFLYSVAAIPQNLVADISGNENFRADYDAVSGGAINPLKLLSDVDKYYRGLSDDYSSKVTQFEDGIVSSFGKGKFLDGGRQIATGIAESIPSIMGMMVGGGVANAAKLGAVSASAVTALPFSAAALQEMEGNTDIPESLKPIIAGLKGFSEVVFERSFGTVDLINRIAKKSISKEGVKEVVEGYMAKILSSTGIPAAAFKGSISEGATTLSQNIIDKYSGVDPDRDLWEGVPDAMVIGGVMDVGVSSAGAIKNKIVSEKGKNDAGKVQDQISSMRQDIEAMDGDAAGIMQAAIERKAQELNDIIEKDAADFADMPEEAKSKISEIDNRISEIDSIIEDSELGEGSASALKEERAKLSEDRKNILSETEFIAEKKKEFSDSRKSKDADTTPVEPSEKPAPVSVGEAIDSRGAVYRFEGKDGRLMVSGKTVEFESGDTVYELGNIDELSDTDISELGIESSPNTGVEVDGNKVILNGAEYVNPNENIEDAIVRDADGNIISVTLETDAGQKRTFRGANADAIAYQYGLMAEASPTPLEQAQGALIQSEEAAKAETGSSAPEKVLSPGERIAKFRKENPSYEDDVFGDAPQGATNVLNRIDEGIPADANAAISTRDYLLAKEQELIEMRSDRNRMLTIPEINKYISGIREDIASIDTYLENFSRSEQLPMDFNTDVNAKPVLPETPIVATVPISKIQSDPDRFQFKSDVDPETGVSDKLKGRVFKPELAGVVSVWVDPADGNTYVVNGHHRFDLARSNNVENIDVRYIDAESAAEVRVIGALQNVAEGMGTPLDAAKIFRESDASREGLADAGLSMSEKLTSEGFALSNLSDALFNAVVQGTIPANVGVIIGRNIADPQIQEQFWGKIKGRTLSQGTIDIMAQDINNSEVKTEVVSDLFGTTEVQQAAYEQRAGIIGRVRNNINKAKNILGKTARSKDFLEQYGNDIDAEVSAGASREAAIAIAAFDALRNSDPEIKGLIDNAVKRVENGETITKVANEISREAIKRLPEIVSGKAVSLPESGQANQGVQGLPDKADTKRKAEVIPEAEAVVEPATETQVESKVEESTVAPEAEIVAPVEDIATEPSQAEIQKEVIQNVSDRLAKNGLAKSVEMTDSKGIDAKLGEGKGALVNGYVDAEGNIVINSDKAGIDTPIHEVSHVWESKVEKENPALHARGMALIKGADGKPYVDHVKKTQPGLQGDALYKEAMAQAIGDSGARIINKNQQAKVKEWLDAVWQWIGDQVGISNKTPEQIANMNLAQFSDAVAIDLLSGRPINTAPNGDIVMSVPEVSSMEQLTPAQQKKVDFMERMRQKNGIKYQGNINAQSLSDIELRDFVEFVDLSIQDGTIKNKTDLKKIAMSIGIKNPSDINLAWNLGSRISEEGGVGIKKNLVSLENLLEINYEGLSDAEYIAQGERLIKDGTIDPDALVQDLIFTPRALQPWEVTALIYHRAQVQNSFAEMQNILEAGGKVLEAYQYQGATGQAAVGIRLDALSQVIRDFETVMVSTANQQSSAFRLRSLMTDKDHNIVSFLASSNAKGTYISPEVQKAMRRMAAELDTLKAKLAKKAAEADVRQAQLDLGNIQEASVRAASNEAKPKRVVNSKKAKESFNNAIASLDFNAFANASSRFQTNGVLRFQTQANGPLSEAISEAVAQMQESVNNNTSNISDAIETAVESINAQVGKGNWNEIAFRSSMVNAMAQNGSRVNAKKPYVGSDGTLVVPGPFLHQAAQGGVSDLNGFVEAVRTEVGDSFTDYQIRNAISGYGRAASKTATQIETDINRAKRIARLLSSVEDLETKGKRAKTPKRAFEIDAEARKLMEQVKELEYGLEMTPEERAQAKEARTNQSRRDYLENYIAEKEGRIRDKDFAPVNHKAKYEKDAETIALEIEAERVRNEFKKEKYKVELENRSNAEKAAELAYDLVFNITRGLSAGADLSAIGVQGALFVASNPIQAAKVFKHGLDRSFGETAYEGYFAELQADPYYEVARRAGLNLQLPNFYQSVQEEQYKGQLPELVWNSTVANVAGKIAKSRGGDVELTESRASSANPYKVADRNYSVVLSKIRFDMFKDFMQNQIVKEGIDVELDVETMAEMAEMINTLTMASKVPVTSKWGNKALSTVFFSARKLLATWKIFLDVFPPTGAVRAYSRFKRNPTLAKDYYTRLGRGLGTMIATTLTPAIIASLMYDEDNDEEPPAMYNPNVLNPIHSDFMKIKLGNTRGSLFQGIDGNVVFATRMSFGEMMTSSSKEVRKLGSSGERTRRELGIDYISNKFAPTLSAFNVYALGKDSERYEGMERYRNSFAPMWLTGGFEQYGDTGNAIEALTLGTLGIIGLGYNNYGGAEFAGPKGTNDRKAKSIIERSGLSVYNPTQAQRKAFDGTDKTEVVGKRYNDLYKPAYEEFMTSSVKAHEDRFAKDVHWEKKEGLINNIKKQAYKYAEIETSGVYMDALFTRVNMYGKQYTLLKSQYPIKVDLVKEYMSSSRAEASLARETHKIKRKLTKEGVKPLDEYVNKLARLSVYNDAVKHSNKEIMKLYRQKKIDLVESDDYIKEEDTL